MAAKMSWLCTRGRQIVNEAGQAVLLKGYCLGGWLNTENFINGYPYVDHLYYRALCDALGPANAKYYYERQLEHYLQEDDFALLAECGTNSVRLPFNYRLFESDDRPGEFDGPGFYHLDRLVKWCRKHGLYIILDLHSAEGWQNPDWHCDNPADVCLLWGDQGYRDRVAGLWCAIARRYKEEPTIAGYELLNEPTAPDVQTLQAFYEEVVRRVRRVDRKHMIFLDGNMWGTQFKGLRPFDRNLVYACHIYVNADFENAAYPHETSNRDTIAAAYQGYADFGRRHNVPMWCGEFGAHHHAKEAAVKKGRLQTVDDQIGIFEGHRHSWAMWTYKDVGVMGLATLAPGSAYMRRTAPVRAMKQRLCVDQWTADHAFFNKWIKPITDYVQQVGGRRLDAGAVQNAVARRIRDACGILLVRPFAEQFRGMTRPQIDSMMKSWRLENCRINKGLARILKKHSA